LLEGNWSAVLPGQVISAGSAGIIVQAGKDRLRLNELQLQGQSGYAVLTF